MTWLLLAAGAVVALGAGIAVGAAGARSATMAALVALVFSPFLADPLPAAPEVAFRIVAAVLAAFLLLVASRRAGEAGGSPLGIPASAAAAAAAFVAGLGSTAVGLPTFGPAAALAAGAAGLVVALPPAVRTADPFRLGLATILLVNAALLLRTAFAGTPPAAETLVAGIAVVGIAAAVTVFVASAATAAGSLPGGAPRGAGRRPPPA